MSGAIKVSLMRRGRSTQLSHVACTLGRHDRPFPERHESAAWTIALVKRGTFRYRAAATNRMHTLRPGWLLVGRPDSPFECAHDHDGGDDCASLSIAEDAFHEVARAAGISMKSLLASPPALPPVSRASALLERARLRDDADFDEVCYFIAESVVAHASSIPTADIAPQPGHVRRVGDAMDYIERACKEPLSLAGVASTVGLSPFHFLRVFRKVTGTTPHQYLIGARIRLAARLLLDTDRPVTAIAYDVGFEDLSNFGRTFRRAVGSSPRTYRRR